VQTDRAVHGALATGGALSVIVLNADLVAQEARSVGAGVGDQRLVTGQFQLEVLAQELSQALFDLLGFGLGSGEPEQVVIAVAHVSQPPEIGITRIHAR
jgi:hypothetical protein